MSTSVAAADTKTAIFAGGCFWCIQPGFDALEGVTQTMVGYTGGEASSADYKKVSGGDSGHVEAIRVTYDPTKVSYAQLLERYWETIDPTDAGGQFADRGEQYETVIFYNNDEERKIAENSKEAVAKKLGQTIATRIEPARPFYDAEEYHQKYYEKNSVHYNAYKYGSGRVNRLKELWGDK